MEAEINNNLPSIVIEKSSSYSMAAADGVTVTVSPTGKLLCDFFLELNPTALKLKPGAEKYEIAELSPRTRLLQNAVLLDAKAARAIGELLLKVCNDLDKPRAGDERNHE